MKISSVLWVFSALFFVSAPTTEMMIDCTKDSLQAAIDAAHDGDTVTIAPGVCRENLVITRNLTLEGAGSAKTILQGVKPGFPVVFIQSDSPITVTIERLTLADAPKASSEPQHGKECALFYPELLCPSGVQVRGEARASISDVRVARNPWVGIYALDTAQVFVQNTEIIENGWGVYVSPDASIELRGSRVERSRENGLEIWGSAFIERTLVRANGRSGVESVGTVKIFESEIAQNRGSGVLLSGVSQTEIRANAVTENGLWGIAANLRKCNYLSDNFRGSAMLDQNRFLGNRSGEVCLP